MASWLSRNLNLAYIFQEKATCAATKHQLHVLNSKGDLGGVPTLQIWGKIVTPPKKAPLKIVNSRMIHLFLSPTEEVSTKAKRESGMEKK